MKRIFPIILAFTLLASCSTQIDHLTQTDIEISIYPDYKGATIPCNIAPIDFAITDSTKIDALIISYENDSLIINVSNNCTKIGISEWRKFLADKSGCKIDFTLCAKNAGIWTAYRPFKVEISSDSIDKILVYRLLPRGHEIWTQMGIYQRDLESFKQTAIYENRYGQGNCVNCHSFCMNNPERMMMHIRTKLAGTYTYIDGKFGKITGDFSKHIFGPVYPYWHPSGKYIGFSLNKIYQDFHTADINMVEVYDENSDVIVYDVENDKIIDSPLTIAKDAFETFPSFSPDGKWLYFCTSQAVDSIRYNYQKTHYNICRIAFDATNGKLGTTVDTVVNASKIGQSASFPRISPDGRFLMYVQGNYGNFSLWHRESDLKMIDLQTGDSVDISNINSKYTESYHSWSSNSRWVVFSSRRGDGLFTRPYFAHIDRTGKASKPTLLPQRNPLDFYQQLFCAYNIPELVKSEVDLTARKTDLLVRKMQK